MIKDKNYIPCFECSYLEQKENKCYCCVSGKQVKFDPLDCLGKVCDSQDLEGYLRKIISNLQKQINNLNQFVGSLVRYR